MWLRLSSFSHLTFLCSKATPEGTLKSSTLSLLEEESQTLEQSQMWHLLEWVMGTEKKEPKGRSNKWYELYRGLGSLLASSCLLLDSPLFPPPPRACPSHLSRMQERGACQEQGLDQKARENSDFPAVLSALQHWCGRWWYE